MAIKAITGYKVHPVETNVELMSTIRESKYDFELSDLKIGGARFIEVAGAKELETIRHSLYNHTVKERKARAAAGTPVDMPMREAEKNGKMGFYVFCVKAEAPTVKQKKAA